MFMFFILVCFARATANENLTPIYNFTVDVDTTLDCSSLGTVKFYQNNVLITNETFSNAKIIDGNKLVFESLKLEQIRENYRCINEESQNSILFDKHPVIVLESGHSMKKLVDGLFEIKVKILNVNHTCTWYKNVDDKLIDLNTTEKIELYNHSMIMNNLDENSSGIYGCLIENEYGLFAVYTVVEVKSIASTLWPFLAVSIQVLLSCIGIFAFEKFSLRKKDDNQYNLSQQQFLTGRMASA